MASVRNLIFAEIEARLGALELEGAKPKIFRMHPGDPDKFPALMINDGPQRVIDGDTQTTRYSLPVTIEGYVQGGNGKAAHEAISDLYAAAVGALAADDARLGGLADEVAEGDATFAVAALAANRRLGFTVELEIQFSTRRGDPAVRP